MRTSQDQGRALSTKFSICLKFSNFTTLKFPSDLKVTESIISEDIRSRKSKVVGFGLVEETQFDQLPNEYEPVIQSSVDIMKPGTSGLQSNAGLRNRGLGL